jgi:hypothetical protein
MKKEIEACKKLKRLECGLCEDDLPAKELMTSEKAELEWEKENKEELDRLHRVTERREKIHEEIKKEENKKRFHDML